MSTPEFILYLFLAALTGFCIGVLALAYLITHPIGAQ